MAILPKKLLSHTLVHVDNRNGPYLAQLPLRFRVLQPSTLSSAAAASY